MKEVDKIKEAVKNDPDIGDLGINEMTGKPITGKKNDNQKKADNKAKSNDKKKADNKAKSNDKKNADNITTVNDNKKKSKPVRYVEYMSELSRIASDSDIFGSRFVTEESKNNFQTDTAVQQVSDLSYEKGDAANYHNIAGLPSSKKGLKIVPDAVTNDVTNQNSYDFWKESLHKQSAILDKVKATYSNDKNFTLYKAADLFKQAIDLGLDENYAEYAKEFPFYQQSLNSTLVSFPKNKFKTNKMDSNGNPIYEQNNEKFDQLIKKYNFLQIFEMDMKFMKETTIPYIKAKKNGTLTQEQADVYKNSFLKHLEKRADIAQTILDLDERDPLIQDNETFGRKDKELIQKRWKNEFAQTKVNDYVFAKKYLDKGWPVQDLPTLETIIKSYDAELQISKEQPGINFDKKAVEASKKIVKSTSNDYKKLTESEIKSPEERKRLLNNFKNAYKEAGNEINYGFVNSALETKISNFEIGATNLRTLQKREALLEEQANRFDVRSVDIPIDGQKLNKMVTDIRKSIKDVDFFMWGTSSKEFGDMLESLEDLEKYTSRNISSSNTISVEDLRFFFDRVANTKKSVEKYLTHKEIQLDKDVNRKDNNRKQKHEQPRIEASLNALDNLDGILMYCESSVTNSVKQKIQSRLETRLEKEEILRKKNATSNVEYKRSVVRSIDMTQKMHDSYYHILDSESFDSFINRLNRTANPKYTGPLLKSIVRSNAGSEIYNKLMKIDPSKKSQMIRRMPSEVTTKKIKEAYNDKLVQMSQSKSQSNSALENNKEIHNKRRQQMVSQKQAAKNAPKK